MSLHNLCIPLFRNVIYTEPISQNLVYKVPWVEINLSLMLSMVPKNYYHTLGIYHNLLGSFPIRIGDF
jgi:hypothetical protein